MTEHLSRLYHKLKRGIVSIEGVREQDPLLQQKRFFPFRMNEELKQHKLSYGSGMVVHERGYILTCHHVVEQADQLSVKWGKKRHVARGRVIAVDRENDLALLKIKTNQSLSTVPFTSSHTVRIGENVFAIGNPFGFEHTLTTGIVSGKQRTIATGEHQYENVIQTDTPLNPGNSGGPLFNRHGKVVGMNAVIIQSFQNVGFAIPTQTFLPFLKTYIH